MKILWICLLAVSGMMPSARISALPLQIVDDLGRTIKLERPASRVIPLYGAFSEMLFAIGAGSEVVARTQADQFPEEISKLPSVGTHMRPNVEIILGLKPDLILQSVSRHETTAELERLRSAGIPVAAFAPKCLEDIFTTMTRLGILTGKEEEARIAVDQLQKRLQRVTARVAGLEKRLRVFFEIRAEPLTAAGRDSIVQDIITAAGAENVVRGEKAVVLYNFESLLMDDPDIYIVQKGPMNRNPLDPQERTHFGRLRAVEGNRILTVDEFLFSRPGPRSLDAVEQLAVELYPDLFTTNPE